MERVKKKTRKYEERLMEIAFALKLFFCTSQKTTRGAKPKEQSPFTPIKEKSYFMTTNGAKQLQDNQISKATSTKGAKPLYQHAAA